MDVDKKTVEEFWDKASCGEELYLQNHPPKPQRETIEERATRFHRLMDENGWTRAELARQLGVSRAWVTKVLGDQSPSTH